MKESVLQIIHNLTDIKNQLNDLAPIEKDILLQEIRQLYVSVLEAETVKTEEAIPVVNSAQEEPVKEEFVETPEPAEEEPVMDFKTKEEEPAVEVEPEPEPAIEPEPEIPEVEPEPVVEEPVEAAQPEPEVATTLEPEPADIADDLLQFLPKEMTEEKAAAEQPEEKSAEEKVAEFSASLFPEEPEVEPVAQPVQPEPKPAEQPKPVEPTPQTAQEKRSLNDLLQSQHEENSLFNKMQQSKINDLLKAISLNDKFLFIKELFNGKGEDFSLNIQKLNNCASLDEAFEELEVMKKHYFWESTSEAYLSLCDLIRRRYIN